MPWASQKNHLSVKKTPGSDNQGRNLGGMACFGMFFAMNEVAKKQQEKQEESAAAAKIQARYRGKKAGKDMTSAPFCVLLLFPCRL